MPNSHVIQYLDNECSVQIPAEFLEQLRRRGRVSLTVSAARAGR